MIRFCSLHGHAYCSQETPHLSTNDKQLFDLLSKLWVEFLFQKDWHYNWLEKLLQLGDVLSFPYMSTNCSKYWDFKILNIFRYLTRTNLSGAQHICNTSFPQLLLFSHFQWWKRWKRWRQSEHPPTSAFRCVCPSLLSRRQSQTQSQLWKPTESNSHVAFADWACTQYPTTTFEIPIIYSTLPRWKSI